MVRNSLFAATAIAVMAGTAMGADYLFPSANPPGGKSPSEVKQYVTFIWDDNAYTGEIGTSYEPRPLKAGETSIPYEEVGYVGGKGPDWSVWNVADFDEYGLPLKSDPAYKNPLNIGENQSGIAWAVNTLGKKMTKGTGHMTFNMISGLFIPTWGDDVDGKEGTSWRNRTSEYGSTQDDGTSHLNIAISWGRENRISKAPLSTSVSSPEATTGNAGRAFIEASMDNMLSKGHEIGNHTVDHIETNSIWPKDLWPNNGDGFDPSGTKDILGGDWDEKGAGYSDSVSSRGWMKYAGKKLETQTWVDILTLGEQDGPKIDLDYSKQGGRLQGFRAPRLEINSNMFTALSEKGYLYDCGVEEGMETDVDGTNFLWPYTVDNGIPNFTSQAALGETVYATSFPVGANGEHPIWEVPVNLFITEESDRAAILAGYNVLQEAQGLPTSDIADWDGKVTGFDFNMFILYAMNKDQALRTLKNTLDLHYDNNRAPMQIGCHTDYFTPMYDNATLDKPTEAYRFALPKHMTVDGQGNTWEDRKWVFEQFVGYANGKSDVEFVSGYELIQNIKALQAGEDIKAGTDLSVDAWKFVGSNGATNSASESIGNSLTGKVSIPAVDDNGTPNDWTDDVYPSASYAAAVAGGLKGMTHISMDYNTNVPLSVRLYVQGDNVEGEDYGAYWEVTLDNKNKDVKSGAIPVSAFQYGQYSQGTAESVDVEKINKIEIAPIAAYDVNAEFAVTNIQTHGSVKDTTVNPDGDEYAYPESSTWVFGEDGASSTDLGDTSTYYGDGFDGEIDYGTTSGTNYAYSNYATYNDTGYLDGVEGFKFDYDFSNSVTFQVWVAGNRDGGDTYDIAFTKTITAGSGTATISISDLANDGGSASSLNTANIYGLGFKPNKEGQKTNIDVSNLKIIGKTPTPISDNVASVSTAKLGVNSISNGKLNIAVPTTGVYSVNLYSATGRLIKSISNQQMSVGMNNSVDISGISTGVYMLRVSGANASLVTKALIK